MSSDDHKALSRELDEHFQERAARFLAPDDHTEEHDVETPETGILTGWVLACEWMGDDGEKWITYHRAVGQPMWLTRGMHAEAIADLE